MIEVEVGRFVPVTVSQAERDKAKQVTVTARGQPGADGREIVLTKVNDTIKWRYTDEDESVARTLVEVNDLRLETSYTFIQTTPSSVWTCNHNLGYKPTVVVHSNSGSEVEADVYHTSPNQTMIYFKTEFVGSARFI